MTTKDVFRDTPWRYCGYANEIGEAFRPVIPVQYVNLSYAVAIAYVLADCADKTYKKYEKPGGGLGPACVTAGDVFVWQMLASVAVPGLCINRVTWGAGRLLARSRVRGVPLRWGPTVAGLGCIPLIIGPIDHAIDRLMDATYRKWF